MSIGRIIPACGAVQPGGFMAENLWVEQYRRETDKEERIEILNKAIAEEGLTEENALRKQLLEARYEENKKGNIDHFIRGWMTLAYLENETRSVFGKKRIQKEITNIRSDLQLDLVKEHGETGRRVLYDEFYNTARLYMSLCEEDKSYNSILLGFGRMKPAKLVAKIAADLYRVSSAIPKSIGMDEELKTFREALTEAFCDAYSKQKNLLLDRFHGDEEK